MPHWICTSCGYYVDATRPPDECPHCWQRYSFGDVTCYTPECGGEKNSGPKVMAYVLDGIAPRNKKSMTAGFAQRTSKSSDSNALCYEAALIAPRKLRDELTLGAEGRQSMKPYKKPNHGPSTRPNQAFS